MPARRGREVEVEWKEVEAAFPGDPLAQMREWVHCGAECVHMDDGRGCDMANAAVELADSDHPARQVIEEFKRKQRDRVAQLARDGGIADAELLADTLCLLLEGARVSRQTVGAEGPCAHLIASIDAVIASFQRGEGQAGEGEARRKRAEAGGGKGGAGARVTARRPKRFPYDQHSGRDRLQPPPIPIGSNVGQLEGSPPFPATARHTKSLPSNSK